MGEKTPENGILAGRVSAQRTQVNDAAETGKMFRGKGVDLLLGGRRLGDAEHDAGDVAFGTASDQTVQIGLDVVAAKVQQIGKIQGDQDADHRVRPPDFHPGIPPDGQRFVRQTPHQAVRQQLLVGPVGRAAPQFQEGGELALGHENRVAAGWQGANLPDQSLMELNMKRLHGLVIRFQFCIIDSAAHKDYLHLLSGSIYNTTISLKKQASKTLFFKKIEILYAGLPSAVPI